LRIEEVYRALKFGANLALVGGQGEARAGDEQGAV
jgi:hypothetical protein